MKATFSGTGQGTCHVHQITGGTGAIMEWRSRTEYRSVKLPSAIWADDIASVNKAQDRGMWHKTLRPIHSSG